jgi:hypothetical protein
MRTARVRKKHPSVRQPTSEQKRGRAVHGESHPPNESPHPVPHVHICAAHIKATTAKRRAVRDTVSSTASAGGPVLQPTGIELDALPERRVLDLRLHHGDGTAPSVRSAA